MNEDIDRWLNKMYTIKEKIYKQTKQRTNQLATEWIDELMNEGTNERMQEQMNISQEEDS